MLKNTTGLVFKDIRTLLYGIVIAVFVLDIVLYIKQPVDNNDLLSLVGVVLRLLLSSVKVTIGQRSTDAINPPLKIKPTKCSLFTFSTV